MFERKQDRAFLFNKTRSKRSRELDRAFDAPETTDVEKWASDPSHFDFPGVDTKGASPPDPDREFTATVRGKDPDTGDFLTVTSTGPGRDATLQQERAITEEVSSARGTRTEIKSNEIESFLEPDNVATQIESGTFDPDFL